MGALNTFLPGGGEFSEGHFKFVCSGLPQDRRIDPSIG